MKKELPKIYDPKIAEENIYKNWEESGYFNPDNLVGEPYSIMMPPPNVTGVLHLGHALENSLMDAMTRFQRMNGKKVLLLPGTDHAAVATQAKVEKILVEQGIKNPREEFGREKLLEKIRDFSENSKSTILSQIRRMGTSCDWSRLAYTFDEKRSLAVNTVFKKMFDDGLIYRGYRVINWSVKGQSTCSDDELVHVERKGKIYTFKYSKDFPISIATTRPETKLGDTAVAVNPNDDRYKKYIGKVFTVDVGAQKPLKIKIIADENVDLNFGTGALGVTPAHSTVDFEMYEKQKLLEDPIDIIQVIDKNGLMTKEAGENYFGLSVEKAREKFVDWLRENNLLEKEEETIQNVGTSDRFGDIVEALPMTQWFVNVNKKIPEKDKSLKELMYDAVAVGHNNNPEQKIEIIPAHFEKIYFSWIENLRDWCISRQVWWGHRIPVWYNSEKVYCGIEAPKGEDWKQDPDTLDTWFSSGLWTFSTLNWPKKNKDLETFYPTNWMQMGYEIIFFWMARMILMSTYTLDSIPFKDVYIHGMLRDEKGQKFSKSLGNTLNPIEIIDKYGCDALRLSLLIGVAPGNDSRFYEEKVESSRNFINKLWNISRYILMSKNDSINSLNEKNLLSSDLWILQKFSLLITDLKNDFEKFQFSQAAEKLREFTWNDFADWYIEIAKFENNTEEKKWILENILEDLLKLWHPFIPFVTESIWSNLDKENVLMIERWPNVDKYKQKTEDSQHIVRIKYFPVVMEIIKSIRNIRIENKLNLKAKIKSTIRISDNEDPLLKLIIEEEQEIIKKLRTGVDELKIETSNDYAENSFHSTIGGVNIFILKDGLIDIAKEKEKAEKEILNLKKYIEGIEKRLSNKEFVAKAPEKIISQQKESLSKAQAEINSIQKQLEILK